MLKLWPTLVLSALCCTCFCRVTCQVYVHLRTGYLLEESRKAARARELFDVWTDATLSSEVHNDSFRNLSDVLLENSAQQWMVSVRPPLSVALQSDLQRALDVSRGAILGYLPENSYLVTGLNGTDSNLAKVSGVLRVEVFRAAHKFAPEWTEATTSLRTHEHGERHGPRPRSEAGQAATSFAAFSQVRRNSGRVVFHVALAPVGDAASEVAMVALEHFRKHLPEVCGDQNVSARLTARHTIQVEVVPGCLLASLSWLSKLPVVHWLAPARYGQPHLNYMTSIVQSGNASDDSSAHAIWSAGLRGESQVVGCGDTGIDLDSCFFNDDAHRIGPKHRKVVMYRVLGDSVDHLGHGTHVSGIAVGESEGNLSDYNGLAPKARVAFTDLGRNGSTYLINGDNMGNDYYAHAYSVGARVHSDSWGTADASYDTTAQEIDEYTWEHQDFVAVVSVGNNGASGTGTIYAPATSKNAIAVGATLSARSAAPVPQSDVYGVEGRPRDEAAGAWQPRVHKIIRADFGSEELMVDGDGWEAVVANPRDACTALGNSTEVKGKVVLIDRGTCFFAEKVRNAEQAGAVAAIVVNHEACGYVKVRLSTHCISEGASL
ncbi:hypothetical protein CYMTET_19460 [Cymbomonas tetramitiformis]|uniref:Subtilisin n=1 Tax=Cymbomonas tetramitiformis TaxID=36881 RepID=A0AAE0G614_9CHLO|nr:hypothetical protein CYMTET_19460 [Cymbomonas tetramitiformis]